jgi:hypothetical protein
MNHTKPLECSCCPRPFAELVTLHNGEVALLIKARHEAGYKHVNVLTLAQLEQMVQEFKEQDRDKMAV